MTTSPTTASTGPDRSSRAVERVVLLAGGDLAAYAAARWVARRAGQHPIEVSLVATDDDRIDGGRAERTAEVLRGEAPHVPVRVLERDAAHRRAPIEEARHADLLVLGSNRATAGARRLPPTRSLRIAEAARCPVVLVPNDWHQTDAPILLGVALAASDGAAVRFAVGEAEALGRPLVLHHVWHLSDVVTPVFAYVLDESPIRAAHAARLDALAERLREQYPSLELRTEIVHGEADREMPSRARTAELVVVGSRGRSSIERVLLGSVGRALAGRPPCPVAIVPPRAGSDDEDETR